MAANTAASPVYHVIGRHAAENPKKKKDEVLGAITEANRAHGDRLTIQVEEEGDECHIYMFVPAEGQHRTAAIQAILDVVRDVVDNAFLLPATTTLEFLLLLRTVLYDVRHEEMDEQASADHVLDFLRSRSHGGVWSRGRCETIVAAVYDVVWSRHERFPYGGGDGGAVPLVDVPELCDKAGEVQRLAMIESD